MAINPSSPLSASDVLRLRNVGLGIAVLMDAFVIRGTLVPAFMKLAGEANWWAPRPLRRLHDRIGFREGEPPEPQADQPADAPDEPADLVGADR